MEINVTAIADLELTEFSDSIANSGLQDIGQITWRNACQYFDDNPLLVEPNDREELESWIHEFGAWDESEIKNWTDQEINALLLQFVASDMQEYMTAKAGEDFERWEANFGGRLYRDTDGELWFYVGI